MCCGGSTIFKVSIISLIIYIISNNTSIFISEDVYYKCSIIGIMGGNMGIFYEASELTIPHFTLLVMYTFALVGINELARKNAKTGIFTFVIVPILLLFFIWPKTAAGNPNVMQWFIIAKVVAILVFAWIILALRYSKRVQAIPWFKYLVPAFLIINMLEAVIREIEISSYTPGMYNDMFVAGGGWNIANATAGIINIILICGAVGIYISKDKSKTMIWPDMTIWWIVAYDFWNFSFFYNNGGDRSFYLVGALFAATILTHFFRRGAWMQHRVFTLSINQLILMTVPAAYFAPEIVVHSAWNPVGSWTISLISLGLNVSLLVYQIYVMVTKKRNSVTGEVYYDTKEYLQTIEEDRLREQSDIAIF